MLDYQPEVIATRSRSTSSLTYLVSQLRILLTPFTLTSRAPVAADRKRRWYHPDHAFGAERAGTATRARQPLREGYGGRTVGVGRDRLGLLRRLLSGVALVHVSHLHALAGCFLNCDGQRLYLHSILLVGRRYVQGE